MRNKKIIIIYSYKLFDLFYMYLNILQKQII